MYRTPFADRAGSMGCATSGLQALPYAGDHHQRPRRAGRRRRDVRLTPTSGSRQRGWSCPLSATITVFWRKRHRAAVTTGGVYCFVPTFRKILLCLGLFCGFCSLIVGSSSSAFNISVSAATASFTGVSASGCIEICTPDNPPSMNPRFPSLKNFQPAIWNNLFNDSAKASGSFRSQNVVIPFLSLKLSQCTNNLALLFAGELARSPVSF